MFYFNDEPVKKSEVSVEDITKINEFKKKVGSLGGYHWTYNGVQDFEKVLRRQLTDYFLSLYEKIENKTSKENIQFELLRAKFQERLNSALRAFESQPIIWVEPILSNTNKISQNSDENFNKKIQLSEIIDKPESLIINAPAQFGLTSLSHYLVKEGWEKGDLWIYLDSHNTKTHNIHNALIREVQALNQKIENVKAIILDSWNDYEIDSFKKLKNLSDSYKDIPIIVMHTIDGSKFLKEPNDIKIQRSFKTLHLLALPRTQIRKVVSEYNKLKEIGSEDSVLIRVLSDLEVLNIHRTPYNCLTLLKVFEKLFDESPVNRTNMIEMILFALFNMDGIPRYRTKPDVKDCEFVLGRFCENMIRNNFYSFSRDLFIKEIRTFCQEKLIELEIDVVFDVLVNNNIIIRRELDFEFKAAFWIYYFAAKRMHNDSKFANYIFTTKKYISFPEIIEFYTGIDRNRTDAIEILIKDISETSEIVNSKVRFSGNANLFELIKWQPTEEQIVNLQNELSETVNKSGLPDEIKDQHADRTYNQIRPYNQSIQTFFAEYSLHNLMQNIRACSRALRNSDYVDPKLKRTMLNEILKGWDQISKVLLALAPILADKGTVTFEGHSFYLLGDFGDSFDKRVNLIIQVNMTNVVGIFKDDIYSSKIAPLLYEHFNNEKDPNKKHQIALLLIFSRPKDWRKNIENYVVSLQKNSFYLYDTYNALRAKYNYDFASEEEIREMTYLIKMCFAKHEFGTKKPGPSEIKRIQLPKPNKSDSESTE